MLNRNVEEVLHEIEENDVKFVRLAFCDIFGRQKNISISPRELYRAFEDGISFDASTMRGFMNADESDLFLVPDPMTLSVLPWRPSHGRVVRFLSSIRYGDGTPFEGDARQLLIDAVKDLAQLGYTCMIGTECEFYLLRTDENGLPTKEPFDQGSYCDMAPLDKGETVRREICLSLEEMGIQPESSHHEQGPGQNEIDFRYSEALSAADNLLSFEAAVKAIAANNGLYASFMPKPFLNQSGNAMHTNLSLFQDGINLFQRQPDGEISPAAKSFVAGIIDKIREITVFLNPLTNSYARFGTFEAPKAVCWSTHNYSQLVRILTAHGASSRMELRSPDPACNPYLAFTLLLRAGIAGIEQKMQLSAPLSRDELAQAPALPSNLDQAVRLARESDFVQQVLPKRLVEKFLEEKEFEWQQYSIAQDKNMVEHEMYFGSI